MSRIEGITPSKKHKTVEDRRGEYKAHPEIHETHLGQKQKIALIIGVSVVVLVTGWIILARSGVVFPESSSDSDFVQSITDELRNVDASSSTDTVKTPEDNQTLDEYDERLFPEFHD